ncbi:MAG: oligosaccharide flippase family protein [Oscillospiraceae bacterium]|nr:oligosaccharide flippase family protein [Oscillospiraceae bacterium]
MNNYLNKIKSLFNKFKKKPAPNRLDSQGGGRNDYAKNITKLVSATAIGQAVPGVVGLIISRMYTPAQFGEFGALNAIFSVFLVLTTCMYEQAIMLPEDDNDAFALTIGATVLSAATSLLWFILLIIRPIRLFVAGVFGEKEFAHTLNWLALYLFFGAGYQIANYWVNRKGMYNQLSANRVIKALSISGINLGFGFKPLNKMFNGVIIGRIAGEAISWIGLVLRVWKKELYRFKSITPSLVLTQLKRYRKFPIMIVPARLINAIAQQTPVLLLSTLFSLTVQGGFSYTYTLLGIPVSLISRAAGDVFRENASILYAKGQSCRELMLKTLKPLALYSAPVFALLMIFSPKLIPLLLGPDWTLAGEFVQILTPAFFMMFIVTPFSFMFMIAERQEFELCWQAAFVVMNICGFMLGYYVTGHSAKGALIGFTISHTLMHVIDGVISYFLACGKWRRRKVLTS